MMNRIEKKCFIGSAALHGLLLVAFVFGSAFFVSKRETHSTGVITIVPMGEPAPAPAQANPDPQPAAPQPEPPQPEPPQPKPPEPKPVEREPEPVKDTPKVVKKPVEEPEKERGPLPVAVKANSKDKPKETARPSLNLKPVRRTNATELAALNAQKLQRERDEKARAAAIAARNKAISEARGVISGVGRSLSHSTVVSSVGVDTSGGEVSGRYGDGLKAIYDSRWTLSNDLSDDESSTTVSVVVQRDGTVKSARITKRSGNSAFDRSVQRALDAVSRVQPFPSEMKDSEREFIWRFERKLRLG